MIKKTHFKKVELEKITIPGAENASIRWLIAEKDGAENFALRMFELEKDGHTPLHTHSWEHEVYALEGEGAIRTDEEDFDLKPGDIAFVPPNEEHQFVNKGEGLFKFLCIIPIIKD